MRTDMAVDGELRRDRLEHEVFLFHHDQDSKVVFLRIRSENSIGVIRLGVGGGTTAERADCCNKDTRLSCGIQFAVQTTDFAEGDGNDTVETTHLFVPFLLS